MKQELSTGRDAVGLALLRQSAEMGHKDSQYGLGLMYSRGECGLAKNPKKELEWFSKAAAAGQVAAQYIIGLMHHEGKRGLAVDGAKVGKASQFNSLASVFRRCSGVCVCCCVR